MSQMFMHREDYAGAHGCLEGVRETMEPGGYVGGTRRWSASSFPPDEGRVRPHVFPGTAGGDAVFLWLKE